MKNFKTFKQLDFEILEFCKLNTSDIESKQRQFYVNDELMKVYNVLDAALDPFYNFSTLITVAPDIEFLTDSGQGGTLGALITPGGVWTITRSTGVFQAGSILTIALTGVINGTLLRGAVCRVESGGSMAALSIIAGSLYVFNPSDHHMAVMVHKTFSVFAADISGLYVKRILTIYDDVVRRNQTGFDEVKDPKAFADLVNHPYYRNRIAFYQGADSVQFFVGETAPPLGNVTFVYRGKPPLFTDSTADQVIFIPPEYNQLLFDGCVASYLKHVGRPVAAPAKA